MKVFRNNQKHKHYRHTAQSEEMLTYTLESNETQPKPTQDIRPQIQQQKQCYRAIRNALHTDITNVLNLHKKNIPTSNDTTLTSTHSLMIATQMSPLHPYQTNQVCSSSLVSHLDYLLCQMKGKLITDLLQGLINFSHQKHDAPIEDF